MNGPATLIVAEGLAAGYGGAAPAAIERVSFEACAGQRIAVLGANGGGKTTLLRVLSGQLRPSAGRLELAARCATVPQTDRSRLDYPVSVLDVATMGSLATLPWWRRPGRRERQQALTALDRVGLGGLADRTFGELSGGQRQRALIARGLVQQAPILLLDEPFSGLDRTSAVSLEALIRGLAAAGQAILMATHDLSQARRWDRVLCLNRRQVAFGPPDQVLDRAVLEATYGGAIVSIPTVGAGLLPAHHHDHGHDHA